MKQIFFWLFTFTFILSAKSQQNTIVRESQTWPGFNANIKFNKKWGIWVDGEIHTSENYFNQFSQYTFRLAGSYFLKNNNKYTAGYGYTEYFPAKGHSNISVPEHFLWEQYQWFNNGPKHKLMQWVRLEEKWKENIINDSTLSKDFTDSYKIRYNIYYAIPLSKKLFDAHTLSFACGDELYLYYSPLSSNHVFDQNRLFVGFSYAVNKHDNLVFGYLNIQQQNTAATQMTIINILRATLFMNINY